MNITLIVKGTDERREFERAHAVRILKLANSQYILPTDSQFEFTANELRRKKDTEDSGGESTKVVGARSKKPRK